ncbi:hypothetical protein [Streptomyces sp. NPDC002889]|uniref:hypothetical protein n=1 Tax=Streptomyces sp. NPDC002889 TaxID=3364669 RepID=UPI0036ABF4B9
MNQNRPDRYDVHTGNVTGQVVIGRDNTVTASGPATTLNLPELLRFTNAVVQALPVLVMTAERQQVVQALTAEILQAADQGEPDHRNLRQLGQSLRTMLEGAAAGALGSGLLSLWTP